VRHDADERRLPRVEKRQALESFPVNFIMDTQQKVLAKVRPFEDLFPSLFVTALLA
jgi:hypothetical protein